MWKKCCNYWNGHYGCKNLRRFAGHLVSEFGGIHDIQMEPGPEPAPAITITLAPGLVPGSSPFSPPQTPHHSPERQLKGSREQSYLVSTHTSKFIILQGNSFPRHSGQHQLVLIRAVKSGRYLITSKWFCLEKPSRETGEMRREKNSVSIFKAILV